MVVCLQEKVDKDPDLLVIFSTKQWAAKPRGISKLAARIFRDPLVYYTLFAPIFVLHFNAAWPQRVSHQSRSARVLYLLWRTAFVPAALCLGFMLSAGRAHFSVSRHIVNACLGVLLHRAQWRVGAFPGEGGWLTMSASNS